MESNLKDKVVMVAGASKGLGFAIAENCAANGAKVSICARNLVSITNAAKNISSSFGNEAIGIQCDVSSNQSIQNWIKESIQNFGKIDSLVVNAGGPPSGGFNDFNDSDWQKSFETTLLSSIRMIREVLPYLKEQSHGSILTITSSSIREPIDGLILSNVMRSAVANLVKSLANELGQFNIRINNIVPGRIDTDRVKFLDQGLANRQTTSVEEIKKKFIKEIPLNRYGKPDEFGKAAVFLLSDAASYISGTTLLVDGGKSKSIW